MLKSYHEKYCNKLEPLKDCKACKAYHTEVELFQTEAQRKLFASANANANYYPTVLVQNKEFQNIISY